MWTDIFFSPNFSKSTTLRPPPGLTLEGSPSTPPIAPTPVVVTSGTKIDTVISAQQQFFAQPQFSHQHHEEFYSIEQDSAAVAMLHRNKATTITTTTEADTPATEDALAKKQTDAISLVVKALQCEQNSGQGPNSSVVAIAAELLQSLLQQNQQPPQAATELTTALAAVATTSNSSRTTTTSPAVVGEQQAVVVPSTVATTVSTTVNNSANVAKPVVGHPVLGVSSNLIGVDGAVVCLREPLANTPDAGILTALWDSIHFGDISIKDFCRCSAIVNNFQGDNDFVVLVLLAGMVERVVPVEFRRVHLQ